MEKWLLNSAKAIGLSHIEDNIPCQDSAITINKNSVYVAVLSDGCGSAYFAHYGSKILVEKVSEYLCDSFDNLYSQNEDSIRKTITNLILDNVIQYAKDHISIINNYFQTEKGKNNYNKVTRYEIMSKLTKDDALKLLYETLFDATVLFVAIKNDKCLIGHCGDGFILGYKNDEFEVISEEEKLGERNETNYPSSIYNLSKAYNDDRYWDLFRIIKKDKNDYIGYTLMSDGAEKSLVSIKKDSSVPIKNNNILLYDIVHNEKPEDATKYLTELLEEAYREREYGDGELVEITDDDVSVAILLSSKYKNSDDIEIKPDETNSILSRDNDLMFYDKKLRIILSRNGEFDDEKYQYLDNVFKLLINKYKESSFGLDVFMNLLESYFNADNEDIRLVLIYGVKCGVIRPKPFEIICDGGDSIGK